MTDHIIGAESITATTVAVTDDPTPTTTTAPKKQYKCPACHFKGEGVPMFHEVPGRSNNSKGMYCPFCWQEQFFRTVTMMNEVK